MQLEQSLTLERPGIFSEIVKAHIVSLSCRIYCVQLRNRRLIIIAITVVTNSFVLTTAFIIILVVPVSKVLQAFLLIST